MKAANHSTIGTFVAKIKKLLKRRNSRRFQNGARVQIVGHWGWPDGTKGTIAQFPSVVRDLASNSPHSSKDFTADALLRRFETSNGIHFEQWIILDEPTDDGSGDGPYTDTSIDPQFLQPLK